MFRSWPILDRHPASRTRYAEHIERRGVALFHRICQLDLEGIVAKLSHGPYIAEKEHTTWFKVRNSNYSQWEGREDLFERERHSEPTPGWHTCDLACAEVENGLCAYAVRLEWEAKPGMV
jgi:hypothetical protein